MNIRTVTLFGIILNIICIIKGQKKITPSNNNNDNNNCIHTSGQHGSCVLFPKCQRDLIGPNLNGNTCGFEGNSPKICCPDQNPKSGGVTLQVFSPKLDFECGEANLLQIFHYEAPILDYEAPLSEFYEHGFGFGIEESTPNEWPWAVLVGVQINSTYTTWICTGSLINWKFVLSAAHCEPKSPDIIRLGEISILNDTDGLRTEDSYILNTFVYPHYKYKPNYHDLVLFELEHQAIFRPNRINPICIPWSDSKQINLINKKMTVVGWGVTEFGGEFSDVLIKADVESFDTNVCDESFKTLPFVYEQNWPQRITEEFYICAGNQTASVDTCQGDSGGPIMYKEGNKYFIGGVTSTGYGCGKTDFPGLYVNLRNPMYLQWIKDISF